MDRWRARLQSAVSPLESGVSELRIRSLNHHNDVGVRPGRTAAVLVPLLASIGRENRGDAVKSGAA